MIYTPVILQLNVLLVEIGILEEGPGNFLKFEGYEYH